jgi:predicted nucleic acid-binding protein
LRFALDTGVLLASVKRRGEKYFPFASQLVSNLRKGGHQAIISILALEELRGGLSSSTTMPSEKILEVEASLRNILEPVIISYDACVEKTRELLLSFRDLKRRKNIPSADFHHLATAIVENVDLFVTIDEKHLLALETRERLSGMIRIMDPEEALGFV